MLHHPIAAIATAPGQGAIAVIRISGTGTFDIGEAIFSRSIKSFKTHTAHYGDIVSKTGEVIDSVILLIMKGPRSYTGEDSIEISCHGGTIVTRRVLERIFEAGASPAEPGEFSKRAYLNGKIDLAQAEAVQELIAAKNELALESAERQLQGALSQKIKMFQKELTDTAAIIEAWVDFPEEGLEFSTLDQIIESLETTLEKMEKLKLSFKDGKTIHEGLSLCLLGSPNVGKSSLMNALLGKDRAIVTDIAGTTRDLLEEDLRLGELHFKLIDTAGIRQTSEIIEQEGIRRSRVASDQADLVLLLLDASRQLSEEDKQLIEQAPPKKTIVVWNKVDLAKAPTTIAGVEISAKEGVGLDLLKKTIHNFLWTNGAPSKEEILITNLRHFEALREAVIAIETVIKGLKSGISAEFVAADMRASLQALGLIVGTNVTEDILSAIFARFCLGK